MKFVVTFTMAVAIICTASVQLATPATQGIQLIRNTDTAARVTQKCQRTKELKVTKNPRNYAKPHGLGYRKEAHKRWHDRRRACQSYVRIDANYWVARQIWAATQLGQGGGNHWPNCPDPFDGGGYSWYDTVACENGGNWMDSPGFYRCGLQFHPSWERRFGRLCP